MGTLFCGCVVVAGEKVSPKTVEEHKEHTLKCIFFWDLILPHFRTLETMRAWEKLIEARVAYQEALDLAFPEEVK